MEPRGLGKLGVLRTLGARGIGVLRTVGELLRTRGATVGAEDRGAIVRGTLAGSERGVTSLGAVLGVADVRGLTLGAGLESRATGLR
jgi:hypothetical protein